jgi:hypothetical protein
MSATNVRQHKEAIHGEAHLLPVGVVAILFGNGDLDGPRLDIGKTNRHRNV